MLIKLIEPFCLKILKLKMLIFEISLRLDKFFLRDDGVGFFQSFLQL